MLKSLMEIRISNVQFFFFFFFFRLVSSFSLSKYLCANVGQIQIVNGGHRRSLGQRMQMLWIFGQQTFFRVDAIAVARRWCRHLAFGRHSMHVTDTAIMANVRIVVGAHSLDYLFAFSVRFVAHMSASANGVLVVNGVYVVDVILHGQIQRRINEECEHCQTAQNQNGNVQCEIFVRQVGEAECVDENVVWHECPEYVQNEQRFEEEEPSEAVNGTIWCWGRRVFGHGESV